MKKTFSILGFTIFFFVIVLLVSGNEAIVRKYFWGSTTYMADSTNYVSLVNKGLYVPDSIKVGGWLFAGTKNGGIYLDTNRLGQIYYTGNSLYMINSKSNGYMYFATNRGFNFVFNNAGSLGSSMFAIDTSAVGPVYSHLQQLKLQGDTASDYNSDDDITLNRQTGILTTKSLSTAAQSTYTLTLTNSLMLASSKVFAQVRTNTSGIPIVTQCAPSESSCQIIIFNAHASTAFSSALTISYFLVNFPTP